ncbi:uncharacterized protein LOC125946817 isoform X2 [Dermacentor silvarum]|uniref:uncharacterized protein LOC125946817 isoform X2 n=1 Tax=Dermacentor silvarum TaxID=543639 RepID=UPI002101D06A|nr:uncharacterized protein LOC125946817 isoform X2 [Dermacentor silvarum]
MNETHIALNRSYYQAGKWKSQNLVWNFTKARNKEGTSYNCIVHDVKESPDHVSMCIRYLSDDKVCAVMEFTVRTNKVITWHELQTKDPQDDMPKDNPCVAPFSKLARTGLVQTFYLSGCKKRLWQTASNEG